MLCVVLYSTSLCRCLCQSCVIDSCRAEVSLCKLIYVMHSTADEEEEVEEEVKVNVHNLFDMR